MLEYEKKLHLDEHWEKMQNWHIGRNVIKVIFSIICYGAIYIALKWVLGFLPDLSPWNSSDIFTAFGRIPFTIADAVYFGIGAIVYLYASIRFYGINQQNHSVRGKSDTPSALLTTGYYSKVRHPMYGVFVLRSAAVLLSLRSFIGIVLTVIFAISQYVNAIREEKVQLIPLFGDSYRNYINQVRNMLLKPGELVVLVSLSVVSLVGLFIS